MSLLIREASEEDIEVITDMVIRLLTELGGAPVDREPYLKTCAELLKQPQSYTVFLAFSESNQCMGVVTIAESHAIYAGGRFGVIREFYVSPEKRSSKIGHELLSTVIEYSRIRNWKRIEVGAPNSQKWERTVSFYIREGFVEIGPRLKFVL
jgi:GNAT superfamily N-acetyltransferase